jgi:hypothetical protein
MPLEDLLAVNWLDGLLVGSAHLSHSDRRVDSLLSEACGALLDQPGIFGEEQGGGTPSQLIMIETQTAADDGINVSLHITRAFRAFSPAGNLIIGIPNAETRFGIPTTTIRMTVPTNDADAADYIVCARQVTREDLKIEAKQDDGVGIELGYPGLEVEAVEMADFKARATGDLGGSVAIGVLGLAGDELVVDTEYVPPVVVLESVASFDDGLVSSLNTLLQDLYRLSFDLVQTSNAATAQGQIGVDLLSRRTDYVTLRTYLLSKLGVIRALGRTSPIRYLREIVIPVATWWRQYYESQFKQAAGAVDGSPVQRLYDLANALIEIKYYDLCAGTGAFLRDSKKLIEGINREIGLIG